MSDKNINDGKATPTTGCDLGNPLVLLAWQRNHLANERTFLAWVRTSLALFAFSFVIERFDFLLKRVQMLEIFAGITQKHLHTEYLTLSVFVAGVTVMAVAVWRYYAVRKLINSGIGKFSAGPDMGIFAVLIAGLFVLYWAILN